MNGHGLLRALRNGASRVVDVVSHADSWRLFGGEPTVTVSSICRHVWFPSPGGPAEYCGRCGAVRPLSVGWADGPVEDTQPTPEPPRPVGPIGWPEADLPGSLSGSPAHVPEQASGLDEEPIPPAPPTARPVGPRVTRPGVLATVLAADSTTAAEGRSHIGTAAVAAVLLSLGAIFGFVIADLTREARDVRGVAAMSPTGSPAPALIEPSRSPTTGPGVTPSQLVVDEPTPTTAPPVGLLMAPPAVRMGGRLTPGGIELQIAWTPPTDGSTASSYDLRMARDAGAFQKVDLDKKTSRSAQVAATANHDYAFRLLAGGQDGVEGPAATTTARLIRLEESGPTVHVSKGWKIAEHPAYTGAGARYSSTAGAELSLAFDGTAVAIVGPTGPGRGRAEVSIDGRRVGRFDALGTRFDPTRLLFKADGLTPGSHELTVRVVGTSGRPIVAVDRFLVLGQP